MAEFQSKPPYLRQIAIYLQQEEYKKAQALSREFAQAYPDEMPAHFLHAKASFWLNDFKAAREAALNAFNLSKGQDELAITGILLACTYYQLREYEKGMELLNLLKIKLAPQENIMKLKFIFALALHDEQAAMRHLDELYEINKNAARELISKILAAYP